MINIFEEETEISCPITSGDRRLNFFDKPLGLVVVTFGDSKPQTYKRLVQLTFTEEQIAILMVIGDQSK